MSEHEHDTQLRDELATLITSKRTTQAAVAREVGLSASALNQWIGGKYAGDNDAIASKLRVWLEAQRSRAETMPLAPKWVSTPTSDAILGTLAYCQVASDIGLVYGKPGFGKTTSIRQHAQRSNNVWHVEMSPSCSPVVPALQEICLALGLSDAGGAAVLHRGVVKRVRETRGLLVIDEAQHLSDQSLEQIRSIPDATDRGDGPSVGLVLCGNTQLYARMCGGNKLDRLHSRIGRKLALTKLRVGDVPALLQAWGLDDTKCHHLVEQIANQPGALRSVTKVLRLASMHALAASESLCCTHVAAAWGELGGRE